MCPKSKYDEILSQISRLEYEASEPERRYNRIRISRTHDDTVMRPALYQPESCNLDPAREIL